MFVHEITCHKAIDHNYCSVPTEFHIDIGANKEINGHPLTSLSHKNLFYKELYVTRENNKDTLLGVGNRIATL